MRVGVISDIHANKVALSAVLQDMPPVEAVICAGDVVGYNPWPAACVEALQGNLGDLSVDPESIPSPVRIGAVPTVIGNHDRMVASDGNFLGNDMAAAGVSYARSHLTNAQITWLRGLPNERTEFDGRVKLVHGHPGDPNRYTYPREFGPQLLGEEDVLVLGHTHVQSFERYADGIVLNPGSVGQPRDGDPQAAYSVLDLDAMAVEERRVSYDIDTVQAAIAAANLPRRTGRRLATGT